MLDQMTLPLDIMLGGVSAVSSGERDWRDFYPTPRDLVRSALSLYTGKPSSILDPCAGLGAWGDEARARWPDALLRGFDLYFEKQPASYDAWEHRDFLHATPSLLADLVVMNPPFKYAEQFVQRGRLHLTEGGMLIAMLKITFLCGQDRARAFWPDYMPASVHTLGRRPSFSGDGKTGVGEEYMLVTWGKDSASTTALEIGRMW